jgi:hypothetical protein
MVDNSKQRFSEFLETVWRSGNSDVGLSGLLEPKVSSKVELAVDDGLHGFEQVGMRPRTNRKCGTYAHQMACLDVEAHAGVTVDGVDCTGKGYAVTVFHSCDKPSCSVCFRDGWARRGSQKIALRLKAFTEKYGEVYHIVASPDKRDYDLPYDVICENTRKAVAKRFVIGGCMIVHAVRKDKRVFSIHFHILGFIKAGYYDKCRHCVGADCHKCDGFEGLTRRLRKGEGKKKGDGYLIKVLEKRNKSYTSDEPNVGGTAFYQLTHASVLKNVERFHVWTWFGVCGYNKEHVDVEVEKKVCPICKKDLGKYVYTGSRPLSDFKHGASVRVCLFDVVEDGVKVFSEVGSGSYRSPSVNMRDGIDRDV